MKKLTLLMMVGLMSLTVYGQKIEIGAAVSNGGKYLGELNILDSAQSFSKRGVLRGLHYQCGEHAQAKLVRVLNGEVLDVAVDIRPNSPTYGQYESILLTGDNQKQFFVPRGFAHGFVVLSDSAVFFYKCDNFYNKESEGGIIFNDNSLNIDWNFPTENLIISEKDIVLPTLENAKKAW